MTRRVSIADANGHFAEYVEHVAATGDHYLFVDNEKSLAELAPVPTSRKLGELPELLRSIPRLSEVEAEDFAATLADLISNQGPAASNGPWE